MITRVPHSCFLAEPPDRAVSLAPLAEPLLTGTHPFQRCFLHAINTPLVDRQLGLTEQGVSAAASMIWYVKVVHPVQP